MSGNKSNCSESNSDKEKTDNSTAIEQKSNDSPSEHTIDITTEQGNSGKRLFHESQKVGSSFKRQLGKALPEKEHRNWELPNEFAKYANNCLQNFVS